MGLQFQGDPTISSEMADSTLCGDCGGTQANVRTHHFLAEVGGPLCRRCFAARTKEFRAANRAKGLCRCGLPPMEGICSRTGRPWATCVLCYEQRRDRRRVQAGRARGWKRGGVDVRAPAEFEVALEFMEASANLRARGNRRRRAARAAAH